MSSKKPTDNNKDAASASADKEKENADKDAELIKGGVLEEDDEFEDFPAEDWTEAESEVPGGKEHLWEESWDDDDTSEDFSKQLQEELKKVEASKK